MAFINEHIPEEVKAKFTFPVSTRPDGSKPTLWKWTIDRERNIYLVLTGVLGGGVSGTQPTDQYVLNWDNLQIRFEGNCDISGDVETKYSLLWKVRNVDFPSGNDEKRKEIYKVIEEALNAKGWRYKRETVNDVTVLFE